MHRVKLNKLISALMGFGVMLILLFPPSHVFMASEPTATELPEPATVPAKDTGVSDGAATLAPGEAAPGTILATPINKPETGSVTLEHEPWEQIQAAPWKLTNNIWGAVAGEKVKSYVYAGPGGNFGWYWDRPSRKKFIGRSEPLYPNVRIGGSPWHPSNSSHFPIRLKEARSLQFDVDYSYPAPPKGSYNLAYDIFLSETNKHSSRPRPRAEVMVWIDGTGTQPFVTYKGDHSDGQNTYELFSWTKSGGMKYYSFLLKELPASRRSFKVNARKLIDKLELDPRWYIHGIELGSEVWDGWGKIEITRLDITMNGSLLR